MIPYGLLPLIFLGLFSMSGNLHTPGWAYSLYIAPLWLLAFYYLIRPPKIGRLEILMAVGAIIWTIVWLNVVTININDQLHGNLNLPKALVVGYNEEIHQGAAGAARGAWACCGSRSRSWIPDGGCCSARSPA